MKEQKSRPLRGRLKRPGWRTPPSTGEQNADLQMRELPEFCEHRGWHQAETYSDVMSGEKDKRPALLRLMADARRGKFTVVAVRRCDRFARSTSHLLRAWEEFAALGIDFVSVTEAMDTSTPAGRDGVHGVGCRGRA
jgi:DNA invertase Pin-like site-specific DNA recombinase